MKTQRVDLTADMFQTVQDLTGREFTRFVTLEGTKRSSDFHSLADVCSQDLVGHHSWLNVGTGELRSSLLHYVSCKGKAPSTTSACMLVPKRRRGSVGTILRRWTVVMDIPTGHVLHVWKDGCLCQEKVKYAMQILYDPVGSEQLHHISQDGKVTMHFVGKAAATEVDFLFDSGASANYLSSSFAKLHGLTVKPSKTNIRLGTGTSAESQGECSVHVKLGDYQDRVDCFVIDMVTDFQVILGDPWLISVQALFDFKNKTSVIRKNNRKFTLSSSTRSMIRRNLTSSRSKKQAPMLSAMQVKRALDKGDQVLIVQLSE